MGFCKAPPSSEDFFANPRNREAYFRSVREHEKMEVERSWKDAHNEISVDPEIFAKKLWELDQSHQYGSMYCAYSDLSRYEVLQKMKASCYLSIFEQSGKIRHFNHRPPQDGQHGCPYWISRSSEKMIGCIMYYLDETTYQLDGAKWLWHTKGPRNFEIWGELDTTGPGGGAALIPDGMGGLTNRFKRPNAPEIPKWSSVREQILQKQNVAIAKLPKV